MQKRRLTTKTTQVLREYMNPNLLNLGRSPTVSINERMRNILDNGGECYHLGFGQSPFPVPNFVVKQLIKYADKKDYLPVAGLKELRAAVSNKISNDYNLDITYDNVLITPGTKEALYLIQLALDGELYLPSPSWVSYAPQATIMGKNVYWVDCDKYNNWELNLNSLDSVLSKNENNGKQKILLLNYPNNPTGMTFNDNELKNIANVCEKYNVIIMSDEIYSGLSFDNKHISMAKYYQNTIILEGLSKWAGAGGWRLGAAIFPNELNWLKEAIAIIASETYTTVAAPIQYAAVSAFEGYYSDEMQHYLRVCNTVIDGLSKRCVRILRECGVYVAQSKGGFYLMPDFSGIANKDKLIHDYNGMYDRNKNENTFTSVDFQNYLMDKAHVASLPGTCFGRNPTELLLRLCYVNFDGKNVLENSHELPDDTGINSTDMDAYYEKYCPLTLKGFRQISDLVNNKL